MIIVIYFQHSFTPSIFSNLYYLDPGVCIKCMHASQHVVLWVKRDHLTEQDRKQYVPILSFERKFLRQSVLIKQQATVDWILLIKFCQDQGDTTILSTAGSPGSFSSWPFIMALLVYFQPCHQEKCAMVPPLFYRHPTKLLLMGLFHCFAFFLGHGSAYAMYPFTLSMENLTSFNIYLLDLTQRQRCLQYSKTKNSVGHNNQYY